MLRPLIASLRRDHARWWALAVILLVPGSLIVLPVIWGVRLWRTRSWAQAANVWVRIVGVGAAAGAGAGNAPDYHPDLQVRAADPS